MDRICGVEEVGQGTGYLVWVLLGEAFCLIYRLFLQFLLLCTTFTYLRNSLSSFLWFVGRVVFYIPEVSLELNKLLVCFLSGAFFSFLFIFWFTPIGWVYLHTTAFQHCYTISFSHVYSWYFGREMEWGIYSRPRVITILQQRFDLHIDGLVYHNSLTLLRPDLWRS